MKRHCLPLAVALLLTTASCSVYHPQAVDIPLINHAGDGRVDVAAGVSSLLIIPDIVTFGGTVSYGFNSLLAGQAHLNYGGDNVYGQLAPGAYLPLGEHSVFEGYAGLGAGAAWQSPKPGSYNDGATHSSSRGYSGHFMLPFGQLNIGWHDLGKAHVDFAFGLKVGAFYPDFRMKYYDDDGNLLPASYNPIPEQDPTYNSKSILVEPQLQFRVGSEKVKYCLRVSVAYIDGISIFGLNKSTSFYSDFLTISNGLTFNF